MKTRTTYRNGNGDTPEPAATIYLCQPRKSHERVTCTTCGNALGEPWVRFFLQGDLDYPVCKRCALNHGFTIERDGGEPLRCRRAENGAIEIIAVEEWTPDRELDDRLDRWLTTNDLDDEGFDDQLDE